MEKKKIIFLIDGFNLYHSIKKFVEERRKTNKYKWIDYKKLCSLFLKNQSEEIGEVVLYTAYAYWRKNNAAGRHRAFIKAQECNGVKVVFGKFKEKDRICPVCKEMMKQHEEKETDVNIALDIIDYALKEEYDGIYIISGDSDLKPAIIRAKEYITKAGMNKFIKIIFPYKQHTNELKEILGNNNHMSMKEKHLESSLMSEKITLPNGNVIEMPKEWKK